MKNGLLLCLFIAGLLIGSPAQEDARLNLPVEKPRVFSLVFNASVMLNSGPSATGDSVLTSYLNTGSSGTFFLGGGIRLQAFKNRLGFRITPGIAWSRMGFDPTPGGEDPKLYPTDLTSTVFDTLTYQVSREKINHTYLEVPVGIYYNITKDEDGDSKFFVEAGGYVGFRIGSRYTGKFDNDDVNRRTKIKNNPVGGLQTFRYGAYGRIGYQWISGFINFRLSDVYEQRVENGFFEGYQYPKIPPLEVGLTIMI